MNEDTTGYNCSCFYHYSCCCHFAVVGILISSSQSYNIHPCIHLFHSFRFCFSRFKLSVRKFCQSISFNFSLYFSKRVLLLAHLVRYPLLLPPLSSSGLYCFFHIPKRITKQPIEHCSAFDFVELALIRR